MEWKRAFLEALKYLTAAEVLYTASVSRLWHSLSLSEELWVSLLGPEGLLYYSQLHPQPTLQETYRSYSSKVCYALREQALYRYSLPLGQWTAIPLAIDWMIPPYTATLSLTHHQLFALQTDGKAFIISVPSGSIDVLPAMPNTRLYPGICLYQAYIYVFAGSNSKKCDKFSHKVGTWAQLPDCLHNRQGFNPVTHKLLIYLPSGCQESIETFDPLTEVFNLLQCQTNLPNSSANLIFENKLIILGLPGYYILDLDSGVGERKNYTSNLKTAWSVYSPVLYGREAVLVWTYNDLWKLVFINLDSFEDRYVAIPNSH